MNGKPYVVGGEDLGARATLHQVEEYDPARGSWREPASLPTALTAPGVVALPGAIPVVGGADATGAARREHFVFRVP